MLRAMRKKGERFKRFGQLMLRCSRSMGGDADHGHVGATVLRNLREFNHLHQRLVPGKSDITATTIIISQMGTLSLRKRVPAILAFISHFRLKQLDLRNDQVHVDRLAAVL